MTLTVGSICSGYEATGLGLHLAGWGHRLAFIADNDPAAVKALAHHHPDVPNLDDITTVDWTTVERVDLLHAGFPCQSVSCAGRRAGFADGTRSGVWAHVAEAIAVLRPSLVLIENVPGLLSTPANRSANGTDRDVESGPADLGNRSTGPVLRAAGAVLGDLATLRYDAIWTVVSAASVGAPHRRERVFILAWPAADAPCFGHRDTGPAGIGGIPAAAVAGGVGTDDLTLLPTPRTNDSRGVGGHGTGGPDLRTAVSLLPTPAARLGDRWGTPNAETAARRMGDEGRRNLEDAIALLPTPAARDWRSGESNIMDRNARPLNEVVVNLLPTPTAADGGRNSSTYVRGNPTLVGALLPTPRATDGTKGGPNQRGSSGDLMLPSVVTQTDRWGDYAPAIARWETVVGRPAPDSTEPGSKGQPRLSAAFVEWMQGLPAGYVTGVPGISRNDALRLLGNSNPPQQYAAAVTQLAAIAANLPETEPAP